MRNPGALSWILLTIALVAACAVGYFAWYIRAEASARSTAAIESAQQLARRAFNERLQSLAAETAIGRTQLESIAGRDAISIIDSIESVEDYAGVDLTVSSAVSGGEGVTLPGDGTLHPVVFILELSGSYEAVMHALALFERLPLASRVDQATIERGAAEGGGLWRGSVRLRVFTTASISS